MIPKPCKWCGSLWHSKNKCPEAPEKPLKAIYKQDTGNVLLPSKSPSERLRIAQSGTSERTKLIKDADRLFSIYIRQRGMDWAGYNTCYTCGALMPWGLLQCGHFMSRRYMNTRWHEMNCWPQCNECNVVKNGNIPIYEKKLIAQHGRYDIEKLKELALSINKFTVMDIQDIIRKYQK